MTLTDEHLASIRARLEAATPGPWVGSTFGTQVLTGDSWNTVCVLRGIHNDHLQSAEWKDGRGATSPESNADFIAHAPTDIAALLDEVERLSGEIEDLDVRLDNAADDARNNGW